MRNLMLVLLVICTIIACTSATTVPGTAVPEPLPLPAQEPYTGTPLAIWNSVDTTETFVHGTIACLRRFFAKKMDAEATNDYWLPADMERSVHPFAAIQYVEFDSNANMRFPPTLMKIVPVDTDQRMITLKWAAVDSIGSAAEVRYVCELLAVKTVEGVRLVAPLHHNTKAWARRRVGEITYIVSPNHAFSEKDAREQAMDIDRLALFFDIPPFPITYYSCADPADLFRAQGFLYHPLMYVHESGGMVDHAENVFSGNDRDIYTHEIVHLFAKRKFNERINLLDEGIAMFLGGSSERPYSWHRANMERYLAETQTPHLSDRCNTVIQDFIFEPTSVPYAIGAIICEHILRNHGKEALFKAMHNGPEVWTALAPYGVSPKNLEQIVRGELEQGEVSW